MVLSIYLFWSQGLISFATTCAWPGALEFLGILLSSIFITYWCSEITDMVYKSTSVSCWGAELGSHIRASALPTNYLPRTKVSDLWRYGIDYSHRNNTELQWKKPLDYQWPTHHSLEAKVCSELDHNIFIFIILYCKCSQYLLQAK